PHGFNWFLLESSATGDTKLELPKISLHTDWEETLRGRPKTQLENALRSWLPAHRWFGGKARSIQTVNITESSLLQAASDKRQADYLALLHIEYVEGKPETN